MELNERMKECLREANEKLPDSGWEEVIHEAFEIYLVLNGGPYEVDTDEEAMELVQECAMFVVGLVIGRMEDEGWLEAVGVDEEGLVYGRGPRLK